MLNIGLGELLVIAVVALVLIRPEDLPGLAHRAGVFLAQVRMNWDGMRRGWEESVNGEQGTGSAKKGRRGE